jgi:hypothetical protein
MGDPLIYAGAEVSATFKTKQSGIRHASSGMMQLPGKSVFDFGGLRWMI